MKWFSDHGHPVTGLDRSVEALNTASAFGTVILADLENGPWPLMDGHQVRQFAAVVVTNYLWRPLFPLIRDSVAPAGLLIYETFARGQETVGRPSRPDFLLKAGELLRAFSNLHIIAFEEGFLEGPPRFMQRIVATPKVFSATDHVMPTRYPL